MSRFTMDTAWPDAVEGIRTAALRAQARDLRDRAAAIRLRAQHTDDMGAYRAEMAEAQALDTEATALERIASRQEATGA